MFYSTDVLTKKGSQLAVVWVAATFGTKNKRLSKRDYCQVDVKSACEYIAEPPEPMALRLSSNLMVGITRVYQQQYTFYANDVNQMLFHMRKMMVKDSRKLNMVAPESRLDAITLNVEQGSIVDSERAALNTDNVDIREAQLVEHGWVQADETFTSTVMGPASTVLLGGDWHRFSDVTATEVGRGVETLSVAQDGSRVATPSVVGMRSNISFGNQSDPTLLNEPSFGHETSASSIFQPSVDITEMSNWSHGDGAGLIAEGNDINLDIGGIDVGDGALDVSFDPFVPTNDPGDSNAAIVSAKDSDGSVPRRKRRKRHVNVKEVMDSTIQCNTWSDFVMDPQRNQLLEQANEILTKIKKDMRADIAQRLDSFLCGNQLTQHLTGKIEFPGFRKRKINETQKTLPKKLTEANEIFRTSADDVEQARADDIIFNDLGAGNEPDDHHLMTGDSVSILQGLSRPRRSSLLWLKSQASARMSDTSNRETADVMAGDGNHSPLFEGGSIPDTSFSNKENDTKLFYGYAKDILNDKGTATINDFMPPSPVREVAAEVFHHLLSLTHYGFLNVNQSSPYSTIEITCI